MPGPREVVVEAEQVQAMQIDPSDLGSELPPTDNCQLCLCRQRGLAGVWIGERLHRARSHLVHPRASLYATVLNAPVEV
jgi:hypothetical protein